MKCVKCVIEDNDNLVDAEYIYHGFSVCDKHFALWHQAILEEREKANSKIIQPGERP